jgi:hypothetical protein
VLPVLPRAGPHKNVVREKTEGYMQWCQVLTTAFLERSLSWPGQSGEHQAPVSAA